MEYSYYTYKDLEKIVAHCVKEEVDKRMKYLDW